MVRRSYFIINGITVYRIVAAPLLLILIFYKQYDLFKWLLAVSFTTDAVDGYLARKYKVTSILGARLDSIADDLTMLVAIIGLVVFKPQFIRNELVIVISLTLLYFIQNLFAFIRYGKTTSFHTYFAKTGAILQGLFMLHIFFFREPFNWLFYSASLITVLNLAEDTLLVMLLPQWETNVKGLYWVMKRKSKK